MKINKRIVTSIAAGKLACGLPFACGAEELTLDEVGAASNVLTLPADENSAGKLHINTAAKKSFDFIVRGIQQTGTVYVFLAYSKSTGFADQWPTFSANQGQLELEEESIKILAAKVLEIGSNSDISSLVDSDNSFGTVNHDQESVVLPIALTDLTDIGTEGDSLYFQSIAIEVDDLGNYLWETAQASEVDKFVIDEGTTDDDDDDDNGGNTGGGK